VRPKVAKAYTCSIPEVNAEADFGEALNA